MQGLGFGGWGETTVDWGKSTVGFHHPPSFMEAQKETLKTSALEEAHA